MGNLPLTTGLFRTETTASEPVGGGTFISRKIKHGITYYHAPFKTLSPAKESQTSATLLLSNTPGSCPNQSDWASSRPLLLFFSWLGAQSGAIAKYRDLYLDRGMDVLVVQSSVSHFLWPRWGLDYGLEVLEVLEGEPEFSGRPVLVHASSIGGYTFTQLLTHIAQGQGQGQQQHAALAQRVIGHIYDSLVVGTLEHMAIGLGKTLVPRLEGLVRNAALLYFWLFKSQTADYYNNGIQVFSNCPITAPALFFFCENDAMCNPAAVEQCMDLWRKKGIAVESRKWKESIHAGHMKCHPEDYLSTLQTFLNSLGIAPIKGKM